MLKHDDNRPGGTYPRPNLFERLRAAFSPSASNSLFRPGSQPSEHMPDLERWTMPHRSMDMADWTVAKNMALNAYRPDRTRLLDLYDSILVDSHLASTMESRVLRVVRSRYRLVKGDKPQPELAHMLEAQWFEDFLQYVAEAVFRGFTLIELGELAKPGQLKAVNRIDPRNVLPWSGQVVRQQGQDKGYAFREPPLNAYLIEVGRSDDLGILCDVGPVAIVKKYAVGSWADYVNKFGIPPRWVRTSSRSAHRVKQLEQMMQQMLSSAYGVIEGDEEIQVMATPGTDAHKVFDELIARMNSEISKRILGQDGTSDNKDASGTYGSLQVLAKVAEDRHMADKASAAYVINNELFPRLVNLGYPFQGVRFEWDTLQDLGPMELVDAVSKLGLVFDIDPKHVEERTGIKILGARRMPGELGGDGSGSGNPPGSGRQGGSKPPKPTGDEGGEDEEEDGVTATAIAPEVLDCGCPAHGAMGATAEAPMVDPAAVDALVAAAYDGADWSQPYFAAQARIYQEGLLGEWRSRMAHLSYDAPDHAAAAAMEINVFRFSAIKTTAALAQLNTMARASKGFSDFKKRVDESGLLEDYNRHKLAAEYHLAVNTGIQSSRYFHLREDMDALPFWEYHTQGDGQVRPAHAALDGKVFSAKDDIWNKIYPPNGWNCRCTVLPVAFAPDKVYNEVDGIGLMRGADPKGYAAMEKAGFLENRAQEAVVFKNNIAYRDELKAKERKERDEVTEKNKSIPPDQQLPMPPRQFIFGVKKSYGRDGMDLATLRKSGGVPDRRHTLESKEAALGWFDTNAMSVDRKGEPVLVMADYSGRKVHITRQHFADHMSESGKRAHRHEVASMIPDVLKAPDEVWIEKGEQTGTGSMNYLKFDQTGIVAVTVRAEDGLLNVATWTGDLKEAQRQGLLMKPYK
jgi:SPP1 gp7 family putative phage head morphogenesis protein